MKKALITDDNARDGACLGEFLLKKGHDVLGFKSSTLLFNPDRIDHLRQLPGVSDFSLNFWSLLCSLAEVVLVYLFACHLWGHRAALVSVKFHVR